jgi:tetratricopeptide (TPR) repeat protein
MKKIQIIMVLCLLAFNSFANPQVIIDSANTFYKQGIYSKAIDKYETVIDSGYVSSGLYYNLGNAYYKNHNIAKAILNYERAKLLDPKNDDIEYNLNLARTHITDKIEEVPEFFIVKWVKGLLGAFSIAIWGGISLITFVLFLALFVIYLVNNKYIVKRYAFYSGIVMLFLAIITYLFAYKQNQAYLSNDHAIIMSGSVTVVSEPKDRSKELFIIHSGTKVEVESCDSNWCEIQLSDGNKGYIKSDDMEMI